MITVLVVGIGSGSPAHLTAEAVTALNRVDVFLVADKRADTRDLAAIRTDLCRAVITGDNYRVIEVADPIRDRAASGYRSCAPSRPRFGPLNTGIAVSRKASLTL